jgi:hypothetical protein
MNYRPTLSAPSFSPNASPNATTESRGNAHRLVRGPEPVIDIGCALDLLAAAVKHRGASQVHRPVRITANDFSTCLHTHNGSPDCIIGEALARTGVGVEELEGLCDHGIRDLHWGGRLPVTLTLGAVVVLHAAQQSQHRGFRWGDVLEHATTAAEKFLELIPDAAFAASIQRSGVAEFGIEPEIETASAHIEEGRHE